MNHTPPTESGIGATDRAAQRSFLERWQARRERKFLERREITSNWFPKLRNRAARRKLVVAYLATLESKAECETFIREAVQPEYDWSKCPDVAERFMNLVYARFD